MLYFNQIVEVEGIAGRLIFKTENNVSLKFIHENGNAEIEIKKSDFSKIKEVWETAKIGKSSYRRLARWYNSGGKL